MLATSSSENSSPMRCEYCSEVHKLCFCKAFVNEPINIRHEFVAKNKICFNCLGSNHTTFTCKSRSTCKVCKKRHHSLLHLNEDCNRRNNEALSSSNVEPSSSDVCDKPIVSCLSTATLPKPRQVLLATALVKAESRIGNYQLVRALLDQGSQACFITEATVQLLNLRKIPIHGTISGLSNVRPTIAKHMVQLSIQSRIDASFNLQFNAYVLHKITSYLPDQCIDINYFDWLDSKDIYLADPEFRVPNKIDLLLGADVYSSIIQEGLLKNPSGTLMAQSTTLGWVISGSMYSTNDEKARNISVMHAQIREDEILKKFWEIEEKPDKKKIFTEEEEKCEELYKQTTKRDENGRYIVKLPFRYEDPPCKAGNSRKIAETRFRTLEKRLERNIELKQEYTKVIKEYIQLGHMKAVSKNDCKRHEAVYLPHHAVIRNDKSTTKVRVVFNASEKNSNGISLNDTLMVGPMLQADLRHTVTKWRRHAIGLVADVEKMYRQIRVAEEDTMYQRILWRDNPEMAIQDYELLTVTFGTSSAPYQAVRTLHQIAYDEGDRYPLAANKVLDSFFMDDLMTGCNTVDEGAEIYKQVTDLLEKGGFKLQKWNSNDENILTIINSIAKDQAKDKINNISTIDHNNKENKNQNNVEIKIDSTIKILGLTWDRTEDVFQYLVHFPTESIGSITKRTVISDIARLFDPLGWLAPCVVVAKIFIQKLWLAGVDWDEQLSANLIKEWCTYRTELSLLTRVKIPRWLGTKLNNDLELHGFSDASKVAYSAVVYLRSKDSSGQVHVSLLVAKTRVAPIKQISIPRLELCGAVLLAKLLMETAEVLNLAKEQTIAWTDSTVVLAWLRSHPSRWKTFVANRTSEILTNMEASQWFHVSSANNPADCASRGMLPSIFIKDQMWLTGPAFLKQQNIIYKTPKDLNINLEESIKVHIAVESHPNSIFDRFSSWPRLLRVVAYCRRFLKKGKAREIYLQNKEIEEAQDICIRKVQQEIFKVEYLQLKNKGNMQTKSSKLKSLSPYLDHKDIMRVRGRLERSQLKEQTKHPIILPKNSHITKLIVADAHNKTMHGGPQLMLNYLRAAYWIIGVRNLRFVSRRGHCSKLWSDNGTTFVGASKELHHLSSLQSEMAGHLEAIGTEWHFIPPHGPNFGGLWEAGVKSTKFHLKRVIGESTLTYEELSTLLTQVEACLNSRPISIINTVDPGEPMPLTPGHFLIGESIIHAPDYTYEDFNMNSLTRWQFVQRMLQSFWRRWSTEYLSNLMNRYKWSVQVPEPKIGDIVLIKEDDLPPSRWLLGRVEQKHPGNDNITRVVTLRTKSSVLKRPTSKLCILPIEEH